MIIYQPLRSAFVWFLSLITAMAFGQILRAKWHWEKQEKIFILRTNKILQLRMLIKFFVLVPSAFMECMFCFLWFCLGIFIIWNTFWGCRKPKHIYCCSEHFFYYLSFIFFFRQYYSLLVTDGMLFSAKKVLLCMKMDERYVAAQAVALLKNEEKCGKSISIYFKS